MSRRIMTEAYQVSCYQALKTVMKSAKTAQSAKDSKIA